MLAAIALMLCTVVLFKMKRERYAFVTVLPTAWLVICTLTAGLQKVFDSAPSVSFLAHANIFRAAADAGKVLAPAKNLDEMRQIVLNDTIDAVMAFIFVLLVASMIYFGVRACIDAWRASGWTARELPEATNGPQVAVPAE
jgi:carbon starvation protein